MKRSLQLAALLFLPSFVAFAQVKPHIFYSDLESGPNTGGQNQKGAFVSIFGRGFGSTRGAATVSIGGGQADNYPVWTDSKIIFQLGAAARSGNIVVTLPNAGASNAIPFTVRAGAIYFVAPSGNDGNQGSFSSPWKTIVKAKNSIAAGDIAYVLNGVSQTGLDDYNASLAVGSAGAQGRPKALVAYPGASVTIGSASGPEFGLRTPSISGGPFNDWVLSGFILRGGNESLDLRLVSRWRVIGNDLSCPNGDGPSACFEAAASNNLKVLGNSIHDSGKQGGSKLYHSLYFTTDSNHLEVGWNVIANNHSCRGIQFHSSPDGAGSGFNQFDLVVHDNLIHGQVCDGINFATIDPSKGPVQAYNNVIYQVGLGPDPPDGGANYACISSPGITNSGSPGSGNADWFNNTLYDCGGRGGRSSGAFNVSRGSPSVRLRNNLVYLKAGQNYLEPEGSASLVSGSNNLWFGVGNGPSSLQGNLNRDPAFMNLGSLDFHLQKGSPAVHSGTGTQASQDFDGVSRGEGYDIGAYAMQGSVH
ncbi:MAG TPA: IPT/TIG domain-containing protein [Candidatus Angelobacter sp.]|nr:IPT/TIG domain-containing protein [Candidatus Angelobacter sp.]